MFSVFSTQSLCKKVEATVLTCYLKVTERSFSKEKKKTKKFTLDNVKFYLAFENAYHCNDYISEKFWRNGFHSETVPLVFGPHPDDVMKVAPPNS